MKEYADYFYNLGLNVTCITNEKTVFSANSKRYKRPSHQYDNLFSTRQKKETLDSYDWNNAIGIGTLSGELSKVNEKLAVLDFDLTPLDDIDSILVILGLPLNYEWVVSTGSKMGFHIYILLSKYYLIYKLNQETLSYQQTQHADRPIHFNRVEILLKSHVVLPPSLHASTFCYEFLNCDLPTRLPLKVNQDNFLYFIEECCDGRPKRVLSEAYFSVPNLRQLQVQINNAHQDAIYDFVDKMIIDIETDGLAKNGVYPRILQIAWYCLDKYNNIIKKEVFAIRNSDLTQNNAYHINGLSISKLNKVGYELNEVFRHLNQYLKHAVEVICYNKEFDLHILNYYMSKSNIYNTFDIDDSICLMELVAELTLDGGYIKLEEAYKEYVYPVFECPDHIAESDVYKTYELYMALKEYY